MSPQDKLLAHEALDRCFLMWDMLNGYLGSHPWLDSNPDIRDLVRGASDLLGQAYQEIGLRTIP